ncbi:hypothetical protein HGRIS_000680 [Hohenbuehelia grisea]|uniref:F-box domain-containing protein n=1 Tax=Hohenbuehelia grisea TaxID=104357 RepID=A0ABR3JTN4_9AGAR
MLQSRSRQLPAELLDFIMTCLADAEDRASLKACSLVHKSWITSTRPHLFAAVALADNHNASGSPRCNKRLIQFLTNSPHLLKYIRHLTVSFGSNGVMSRPSLLLQESTLPEFLFSLTHLTTLKITAYNKKWGRFSSQLLKGFLHAFGLPTLKDLHLHGWNFAPNASDLALHLAPCAESLAQLTLRAVEVQQMQAGAAPAIPNHPHETLVLPKLKDLIICPGFRSPRMSHCPFAAPKLAHLHWACLIRHASEFAPFLQQCAPEHLSSLALWVHFASSSDVSQFPDISGCTVLTKLQINISYFDTDDHDVFIRWAAECLSRFPNLRGIESISLDFHLVNEVSASTWDFTAWERLDSDLFDLYENGALREVALTLGFWDYNGPGDPDDPNLDSTPVGDVARNIVKRFLKLQSSRILRARISPNWMF